MPWMGCGWGICFFRRGGLGWETVWERGFGCCLCHLGSGRWESRLARQQYPSAWVPKRPSGNQKSAGVSPANTPDEAHRSVPGVDPPVGQNPRSNSTWSLSPFLTLQWGRHDMSQLLSACSAWPDRSPHPFFPVRAIFQCSPNE